VIFIAEAFPKHLQSVYSSSCPGTFPFINQSTQVLFSVPVSHSDVRNAIIKRLRPAKSAGLDGIPSVVVTQGCSEIFVPVLKFILNLSLSQNTFANLWKQVGVVFLCWLLYEGGGAGKSLAL
jgi:hypothetical protein